MSEGRDAQEAEDRVRQAIIDFVPGLRRGGEPGWDVLDDFNRLMGRYGEPAINREGAHE